MRATLESPRRGLGRVRANALPEFRLVRRAAPALMAVLLALPVWTTALAAQAAASTPAPPSPPQTVSAPDSLLVLGILTAEELRQAAAPALAEGRRHSDPWIRWLASRAASRIADHAFAARDSLGNPAAPLPSWPAPEWQSRLDALTARVGCDVLAASLTDVAPLVQLRAATVASTRNDCAAHPGLRSALRAAVDALPAERRDRRDPTRVSWQLAAQSIIALARLEPAAAQARLARLAGHPQPQVRRDAARAAALLRDEATLRALSTDADANVLEAVLEGLQQMYPPSRDSIAERLLGHPAPQVIRVAAEALQGRLQPGARTAARGALERLETRRISYERDARLALRQLLGMPAVDAISLPLADPLLPEVVGLARGERRYLEVTIAAEFGGGRFVVELRGDVAPIMAARILARARAGDYDGTTWHRVVPNFIVQGLSPDANEYVGYDGFLVDELSTVPHPRGSVGMSTRGHDTGDAQWFINTRDNPRLTPDYTVFAAVVVGMEVVDRLLEGDVVSSIREVSAPRP